MNRHRQPQRFAIRFDIRSTFVLLGAVFLGACSTAEPDSSAGDSYVHDINCPNFMTWEMCLDRAKKNECDGANAKVVSPSIEELEASERGGSTVPVEGKIRHRTIRIACELKY